MGILGIDPRPCLSEMMRAVPSPGSPGSPNFMAIPVVLSIYQQVDEETMYQVVANPRELREVK